MSKILLINPPMLSNGEFMDEYKGTRPVLPPLGLAYIAAVLEKDGHKVRIFDGMVSEKNMDSLAKMSVSYDMVGITATTFIAIQMHRVAKAIKQADKDIPIIVGGAHPTVVPAEVLNDENIDYVVIGEGEQTMLELIQNKNPEKILGIGYKNGRRIKVTNERPLIKNLDDIPLPARHLLQMNLYRSSTLRARRHPALHMMSSRGCPHNCSFCSNKIMHRQRLRVHSPERVVEEMELLINKYHAKEIHFWDDNLAFYKKRIMEICALIKERNIDIPWNCESRVDTVDPEILKKMHEAGCYQIGYGIESGSNRILKNTNKNITRNQIKKTIEWTKNAGIETRGYFMVGFVGETLKEMEQTIKFPRELDLDYATFSTLVPLPGSLDYERAKKEGQFDKYYWRKIILSDISFPKKPIYVPRGITAPQLISIHRRAVRKFYLRPNQIIKKLKTIEEFEDIKRLFNGVYTLMRNWKWN